MNSPKKQQITLRLNPDLLKKIVSESNRLGISQNAFISISLTKSLAKIA